MQRVVDDREIALIVDIARIGGNLTVDAHPEVDVRLQSRRFGDGLRGTRPQHGKYQQQAGQADLHSAAEYHKTAVSERGQVPILEKNGKRLRRASRKPRRRGDVA